jgi:MoCo/4Fe-4S cofactor protein with predicted Tat translocation signal
MTDQHVPVQFEGVRRRAGDSSGGRRWWRSLEELAETPQFLEFLHREFPEQASEWSDPEGRRQFLKIMGASLALAGLTACTRQPEEKVVPYVKQPEQVVPGRPLFFATAVTDGGYAKGVLVESHLGRPTKIEGNPEHPASLGATDLFGQAAVLDLYDPDRSQTLTYLGEIRPWAAFLAAMRSAMEAQRPFGGAGMRFLTGTITSPALAKQLEDLLAEFPAAKWHQWEPAGLDNVRAGTELAFGEPLEVRYHLDKADVVLTLDADFVGSGPGRVRSIREFTARRRLAPGQSSLNRLYVIESTPSLTGALADHRLAVKPSEVEGLARAVAAAVGLPAQGGSPSHPEWVGPLVRDLQAHLGACLVMAGEAQPPAVHALAHALNERLGAVGQTVSYGAPVVARPVNQLASLTDLAADMEAGKVALLVIVGINPVYTAPSDLAFAQRLEKVAVRVHLGQHRDETGERCHWHVPEAHPLETWSDARAFDGTATILQPLIAPLYGGKSAHELLAAFTPRPERTSHEIVRAYWAAQLPGGDFDRAWRRALHDGLVAEPAREPRAAFVRPGDWTRPTPAPAAQALEISFRPDPTVHDGRFANNGWLQELPKPLTKLTWENAALLSPADAERLAVRVEATSSGTWTDVLELRYRGRTVKAPAWVLPGHPDGAVTVHLGYGRTRAGRVGTGQGFDAYALRTSDALWFGSGLEVVRTGERTIVANTQEHWSIDVAEAVEQRHPIRAVDLVQYQRDPHVLQAMGHDPDPATTLYPPYKYEGHAWGMAIDLNACVGCNACVVACQSENNIPVVGKEQVARGREMHWIRIDRYYSGPPESPQAVHQPLLCMHCENAPCEVVCPVAATVHSDEGLNDMVYNRCIGTRYCSNNCPYKVRRFNFFLYNDWNTESLKLQRNPDVTVRSRGVMEKCTYCVQRIQKARIDAGSEGRSIRDGEITTACQQACPGEAIVFGDVNDPKSRVSQLKANPRNYGLLTDLNTRPRTTYLGMVRNPNPEMPQAPAPDADHG